MPKIKNWSKVADEKYKMIWESNKYGSIESYALKSGGWRVNTDNLFGASGSDEWWFRSKNRAREFAVELMKAVEKASPNSEINMFYYRAKMERE